MCSFDLDTEYYTPWLSLIYHAVSNTSQIITVILFPPLIYLILRESRTMMKYRYYMLIHTVISFFFTSFIWLVKPMLISQKYGIAVCGPIADLGSRKIGFVFFILLISCWMNTSISFSMSIIYRAFSPFPGRLQKFCDNSIGYILFIVFTVIFSHTTVITAITFTYTSESTTIQFIQEYFPEMALFQSRNMYFQIPPTKLSQYFCLSIFICYSAYYLFGGVVYGIFTYKIIKFNKMTHSKELAKLQMMLFKTTTFQGIFELLLVITPVYIMVITFYFQVRYVSQIMTIAMTACSVQAWLNYVFVMYNVVPYRKAIKRWFMVVNFGKKECCKNTNSNSVMPVTSIYNPYGR